MIYLRGVLNTLLMTVEKRPEASGSRARPHGARTTARFNPSSIAKIEFILFNVTMII